MAGSGTAETISQELDELIGNIEILQRLADYSRALTVRAACSLEIADYLADGPLTVTELAGRSGYPADALARILRGLAAAGIVAQTGPGSYALGAPGELLRADHPLSMRDAYELWPLHIKAWSAFEFSVRTGEAAFEHVHGVAHREYRARHLDEDARMDRAHRAATNADLLTLIRSYDWSASVRVIVDVGGGTGALLAGLLTRHKQLRGVLFDLPTMVARSGEVLDGSPVAGRIEVAPGDFFDSVPAGGDLYVLKAVLGGWSAESAVRILRTIRAAMSDASRLLIIEPILQHDNRFTMGSMVHLQTLVLYGGLERTAGDYDRIAAGAGLRLQRLIPRPTLSIMEFTTC